RAQGLFAPSQQGQALKAALLQPNVDGKALAPLLWAPVHTASRQLPQLMKMLGEMRLVLTAPQQEQAARWVIRDGVPSAERLINAWTNGLHLAPSQQALLQKFETRLQEFPTEEAKVFLLSGKTSGLQQRLQKEKAPVAELAQSFASLKQSQRKALVEKIERFSRQFNL
ncbi:MAG: hypothetical protein ACM3YO_07830, partial [Bacteroidota bacterium]